MDLSTFYNNGDKKPQLIEKSKEQSHDAGDDKKHTKKLIGIDGHWYDITSFIPHHPGGNVIEQYVGKDASAVFHGFHKQSVLKYRKPCGRISEEQREKSDVTEAFKQLGHFFEKEGYFNTDYNWYAKKFLVTLCFFLTCLVFVIGLPDTNYCKYFGAVALAAFWQQCGFFMHDFEHNQLTHNRHIDKWFGTFFGTVCLGISGTWWREEHFIHHALTTCVDDAKKFADPQMMEPVVWCQNRKLWPFFQSKLAYYCIKIQHFTFIPLCVIAGRITIMRASMVSERRPSELIAFLVHWAWIRLLLSNFGTVREMVIFYAIAALLQGVLHIQLLISHYAKDFHDVKDIGTNIDWYQMQVESNIDIVTPWWLDWFHGGLNFHLIHHLYPRMPRHNYRKATKYVQKICEQHNLVYDHCGWFEAVSRTLSQLKLMSEHFSLDPR